MFYRQMWKIIRIEGEIDQNVNWIKNENTSQGCFYFLVFKALALETILKT